MRKTNRRKKTMYSVAITAGALWFVIRVRQLLLAQQVKPLQLIIAHLCRLSSESHSSISSFKVGPLFQNVTSKYTWARLCCYSNTKNRIRLFVAQSSGSSDRSYSIQGRSQWPSMAQGQLKCIQGKLIGDQWLVFKKKAADVWPQYVTKAARQRYDKSSEVLYLLKSTLKRLKMWLLLRAWSHLAVEPYFGKLAM